MLVKDTCVVRIQVIYVCFTELVKYLYLKKNKKGPNIDLLETPQFMVTVSKEILSNETEKALFVR